MLIPICGLMGMAVELGNGVLVQRVEQHAADSAALAAATGNDLKCYPGGTTTACSNTGTTYGYVLEAQGTASKYTGGAATVTPILTDCPGSPSGTNDCYKVTVTRTVPVYLAQVVGLSSLTPTAVAYARTGTYQNDCLIATSTDTSSAVLNISGSTNVSSCYARGNAEVDCSGNAVPFLGVIAFSEGPSCRAPYIPTSTNFSDTTDPTKISTALTTKPPSGVTCSTDVNNLTWSTADTSTNTQYARVCSTTANLAVGSSTPDIGSSTYNRVLFVDNVSIDLKGNTLSATNFSGTATSHTGTTIVGVNTTAGNPLFTSTGNGNSLAQGAMVKVIAPTNDQLSLYSDYALVVAPNNTTVTNVNVAGNGNGSNSPVSFNLLGVVFAPNSNLPLGGANTSDFSSINAALTNCTSIVAYTIVGGGSKLTASGCSSLGYTTPRDFYASVALVG
jgi:Flp pilus assembly protein TadG